LRQSVTIYIISQQLAQSAIIIDCLGGKLTRGTGGCAGSWTDKRAGTCGWPRVSGSTMIDTSRRIFVVYRGSVPTHLATRLLKVLDDRYSEHTVVDLGPAADRQLIERVVHGLTPHDVLLLLVDPDSGQLLTGEPDVGSWLPTEAPTVRITIGRPASRGGLALDKRTWNADLRQVTNAIDRRLTSQSTTAEESDDKLRPTPIPDELHDQPRATPIDDELDDQPSATPAPGELDDQARPMPVPGEPDDQPSATPVPGELDDQPRPTPPATELEDRFNRGRELQGAAKHKDAVAVFEQLAKSGDPNFVGPASYALARSWEQLGNPTGAINAYQRAVAAGHRDAAAAAAYSLGKLLARRHEFSEAADAFDTAARFGDERMRAAAAKQRSEALERNQEP